MKITTAESQIMDVLWRGEGPMSVEDIQGQLQETWADGTIRAFLSRLLQRQAVSAAKEGKRALYRPLIPRGDYVHAESKGLIDRLFEGRVAPFVAEFSQRQKLDAADLAELRRLLDRLEDDAD